MASFDLEAEARRRETLHQAIPVLERMVKDGTYSYMAGTLLVQSKDLMSRSPITLVDIKPIEGIECPLERKVQYLASKIYVSAKTSSFLLYAQAAQNIKQYEQEEVCN